MRFPLPALLTTLLVGCPSSEGSADHETETWSADERMLEWLSGSFDSEQQSIDDPQYFAVQLITCPVNAPELGASVVYVEQAMMDTPNAPYRQRLYEIESEASDDGVPAARTMVHALHDERGAVGVCDRDERITFTADDVALRDGCDVVSVWSEHDGWFEGGTRGTDCGSTLLGATYATSEVTVQQDSILSWDRGFDGEGVQVWGATAGAYRFVRRDRATQRAGTGTTSR